MKFRKSFFPETLEKELLEYIRFGEPLGKKFDALYVQYEKEMAKCMVKSSDLIPLHVWMTMHHTEVEPWEPEFDLIVKDLIDEKEFGILACIIATMKQVKGL